MQNKSHPIVTRRRVFYIPGFDPMPPRRYRELYRTQSAHQAQVSGYEIALHAQGAFGWEVNARMGGQSVQTQMQVLVWSDIVKSHMRASIFSTYRQMLRTVWTYLSTGALWRLMRLRKGPVIAAIYPVAMLVAELLVALLCACVLAAALQLWIGQVGAGMAGIGLIAAMLWGFRAFDGRLFAYYLMQDFAFAASARGAHPAVLEARIAAFVDEITKAMQEDVQEVLIVGHSSGASIAVSVVADVLRAGQRPSYEPKLSLLTLGHVVPMTSFLPEAHRLRADLACLAGQTDVAWVDVTAPGDGCSFALCDPVAVSGVAPAPKHGPLVLSAAFSQTLSPARWKALRWRFFRLHFQYLCAFDVPNGYDYFQITAGPQTLGARFDSRLPSPSRIERPASAYTSVAA